MPSKLHQKYSLSMINTLSGMQLLQAYDLLPDILFWIKDTESRVMHANQCFLDHIGIDSLAKVIGLNDYDFAPEHIAKQFIEDDKWVIKGRTVTDRLEMNIVGSGEIFWFVTSKRPLYDDSGQIIGSYGTSRNLEKTSISMNGMHALKIPVAYINENYMYKISLPELAKVSYLSVSALERRFKKYLNKTPKQHINDIRLENARRMLVESHLAIAFIAEKCGFPDPSYFSRRFQKKFGELPSVFRASYQS